MSVYERRAQWGSTQGDAPGSRVGKQDEIVIHHSWKPDVPAGASVGYERRVVKGIQDFHVSKGWDDLGYGFLVFQSGRAYEGRGWFRTGAHAQGANDKPSICFVINGDEHEPTEAAWNAAAAIIREGVDRGALDADYRVTGHHDYSSKSCPGTRTYPLIQRLEGSTVGKKYAQAVVAYSEVDIEHARVLSQTYELALCRIGGDSRLWSLSHPGNEATVGYAFLVGQAASRAGHLPFVDGTTPLAGSDRDGTAKKVGEFIESHRREDMERRGKPWR